MDGKKYRPRVAYGLSQVSASVSRETRRTIENKADEQGVTMSFLVGEIVENWVQGVLFDAASYEVAS
jgi:hypothetical protein